MTSSGWAELVALDRAAVEATLVLTSGLTKVDLSRPTPCEGWVLSDLLAHMTGQQLGFATAAGGGGSELSAWAPVSSVPYAEACAAVLAAFAEPALEGRLLVLPEIALEPLPAPTALRIHLLDNAVHAWDVAATLGVPPRLPEAVVTVALAVAERVPADEAARGPGRAFGAARPVYPDDDELQQLLHRLGRDPDWRAPRWTPGQEGHGPDAVR